MSEQVTVEQCVDLCLGEYGFCFELQLGWCCLVILGGSGCAHSSQL